MASIKSIGDAMQIKMWCTTLQIYYLIETKEHLSIPLKGQW
jgi:hypothetical protein